MTAITQAERRREPVPFDGGESWGWARGEHWPNVTEHVSQARDQTWVLLGPKPLLFSHTLANEEEVPRI